MEGAPDIVALNEEIKNESAIIDLIQSELRKVIVGQNGMVEGLLIGLLANGHILLEGVPGLAKTLAINSLSKTLGGSFSRVQFTPDLLPSDVIGTQIYNMKEHAFDTKQGPIFSNFVLADEINRAPAKVQSALLEAMQERQVTIGEESYPLPKPFLVMATQNPVEQEGTYPLPEAQMDRFLLKVTLGYPTKEDELDIMRKQMSGAMEKLSAVVSLEQIVRARGFIERIYMDEKIENYILDIVFATREPQNYQLGALRNKISFGASPRGSIALAKAAKCHAFLRHRGFVTPDDVRAVAPAVLRHRIGLTYEAEAEELSTENIVTEILNTLMVP
ncbi:MAG: MoxR family ATPase [Cryomorphaceae bacterium]|jgi:MoxR-like ATPase|nr:MoxR family ATPase [Cryomorphaceae bacterium]MBT4215275.1 MoxR family ATPase [Bacteroidota bacterium]MCH1406438.1 MoxR family ATPase [Schleiferiaceae bacterium]MCO4791389.1 MoxR family ATPase [Flavobacteriales bacterium]MDA7549310.1 MoxR family ATPase [bacterium]